MTGIGYMMAIQWGCTARHSVHQNAAKRDFAAKSDSFLSRISYTVAVIRRSLALPHLAHRRHSGSSGYFWRAQAERSDD
jgi:hypothetical protein